MKSNLCGVRCDENNGRPPRGGRGLKLALTGDIEEPAQVAPLAGGVD